jgi:hypothetical protein
LFAWGRIDRFGPFFLEQKNRKTADPQNQGSAVSLSATLFEKGNHMTKAQLATVLASTPAGGQDGDSVKIQTSDGALHDIAAIDYIGPVTGEFPPNEPNVPGYWQIKLS